MRTFLGLSFSVAMVRRIAEQLEKEVPRFREGELKNRLPLAWVPPANLHVTLKFFGSIPPESLDAITLRLRQRLVETPAFPLRVKSYGAFPAASEGPPRILWIGVAGGKPLEALHGMVEREMEDLGFAREPRPFHPHITVARVLSSTVASDSAKLSTDASAETPTGPSAETPTVSAVVSAAAAPLWVSDFDFGEEKVEGLLVYESVSAALQSKKPNRAGVEYLVRARVPFSKDR
jgi:2'-5' RNA ligase